MNLENIENTVISLKTVAELQEILNSLRVYAANEKSKEVIKIINIALQKSIDFKDRILTVNILELKIKQFFSSNKDITQIEEDLFLMKQISRDVDYQEGLILAFSIEWGIERLKGNKEKSLKALKKAMELLETCNNCSCYTYNITHYSYAVDKWKRERDPNCAYIFEECINYFENRGYYRGLIRALGYLSRVYFLTQKRVGVQQLTRNMYNRIMSFKLPKDLQAVMHYFLGATLELDFFLCEAEKQFLSSKKIFERNNLKTKNYIFYLPTLSRLSAIQALKGKITEAKMSIQLLEAILQKDFIINSLDTENKKQIIHSLNLTKFYINSRLQDFQNKNEKDLIQTIFDNIDKYHSNAIFFSEYLLSAKLSREQLIEIKNLGNPNTKRVEHIINFLIERTDDTDEQQVMNYTSALKKRPVEDKMTFTEKAFADLLAAQEYYKINRFAEIYPLLKKYEKQLHKIEVLEMRVFMEAFIQVGAFKNGDPLGPALQYMAIKKCRQHGFSRLENKLLNYLSLQGDDTIRMRV